MISIIIRTYNRAILLKLCLNSLLKQEFPKNKFEIIIVDDGSSDKTKQIVSSFKRKFLNLKYFKHKNNLGVAASRNTGIKNSSFNLVAFVADDYILPKNYLETIKSYFGGKNSFDVMSFDIQTKENSFLSEITDLHYKTRFKGTLNELKIRFLTKYIKNYSRESDELLPASGGAVFKKEVFNQIGLFDESFRYSEDNDFAQRMKLHNLKQYQNSLIIFRDNKSSIFESIKKNFYSGKYFIHLKIKHGTNYKPFIENDLIGCLKLFFCTPILSLIRILKVKSCYKRILFFPFILSFDYAFFTGFVMELLLLKFRKISYS